MMIGMWLRRAAVLVAALLIASMGGVVLAQTGEPPALPESFYGTVRDSEGRSVQSGTVEAVLNGRVTDAIPIRDGSYGGPGGFDRRLVVAGSENEIGATIRFRVNGVETLETAPYEPAKVSQLNLRVLRVAQPPPVVAPSGGAEGVEQTTQTTTQTVPPAGGRVKTSDGTVEVEFPSGAITGAGTVTIAQAAHGEEALAVAQKEAGATGVLAAYRIEMRVGGSAVTGFEKPVTIRIKVPYCGSAAGLYYYDPVLQGLVPVASSCADGTVTAQVSHFTVFLVMGDGDGRFTDVGHDHWAAPFIQKLAKKRIVKGVGAYRFEPGRSVTRAEVTKMLVLAAGVPGRQDQGGGETAGHWARSYVAAAQAAGAIRGYPDGTVRPDGNVTRAELAAMVTRFLKLGEKPASMPDAAGHWASGWVGALVEKGVLKGYPDGTFRPDTPVTRAEAARLLAVAFGWSTLD